MLQQWSIQSVFDERRFGFKINLKLIPNANYFEDDDKVLEKKLSLLKCESSNSKVGVCWNLEFEPLLDQNSTLSASTIVKQSGIELENILLSDLIECDSIRFDYEDSFGVRLDGKSLKQTECWVKISNREQSFTLLFVVNGGIGKTVIFS